MITIETHMGGMYKVRYETDWELAMRDGNFIIFLYDTGLSVDGPEWRECLKLDGVKSVTTDSDCEREKAESRTVNMLAAMIQGRTPNNLFLED